MSSCDLQVSDQTLDMAANSVSVDTAYQPLDGYIAIHESTAEGGLGGVIGSLAIAGEQTHTNVTVPVSRTLVDGEVVWPMLHTEDNDNGMYDDASTDTPLVDEACGNPDIGNVAVFPLTVTVESMVSQCTLTVADQSVGMDSSSVIVAAAMQPLDGYVVVHESTAEGGLGGVIGSVAISGGQSYTNISVPLDRALVDGEKVWPMLHTEDNDNSVYDDAATDKPYADEACGNPDFGGIAVFPLITTVQAEPGPPDTGSGLAERPSGTSNAFVLYLAVAGLFVVGGSLLAASRRR